MDAVRTWAFRIVFYTLSVPIVASVPISALFGRQAVIAHATLWTRFHRWAAAIYGNNSMGFLFSHVIS